MTTTEKAEPEKAELNGEAKQLQANPPTLNAVLREIIEAEMTPDGRVDNQRVLTLARLRYQQTPFAIEPTMRSVQQVASVVRKQKGLHDKVLSDRMRKYVRGRENQARQKPAENYRAKNIEKARIARWAKAKLAKVRQDAGEEVKTPATAGAGEPAFNQMQLLAARSFLATCGNDASTAVACLKTIQSLAL